MTNAPIYPLTFAPVFRDYVWGGRHLETLLGRDLPPGIVAESWEISGHPSSPTAVDAGPLAGLTLPEVQARLGAAALVGRRSQWATDQGKFPLLVKLLDANQRLSVQVHPPDAYALAHEGELGKAEMWYILHAEPGAELIYGLSQHTTRETFRAAVREGTLTQYLHRLPIAAGDAIMVATGTLHALLEGAVIVEIQQNSDTTYRVYDWGRMGKEGTPRPLHIEQALEVIDFDIVRPGTYTPLVVGEGAGVRRAEISRCPYFVVQEVQIEDGAQYEGVLDGTTFEIWGCVEGKVEIAWAGDAVPLSRVRFCLLPAQLGEFAVRAEGAATLLRAYAPDS